MIVGSFSRGSTPIHVFTLPFSIEEVADLRIVYKQSKNKVLSREKKDVNIQGNDVVLTLTQEDTFLFNESDNVEVQLKVKTINDQVFNSDIMEMKITKALDDEVI